MAITRIRVTEGSSHYIEEQILDKDGNPVDVANLTAATLTLYDVLTLAIINGRDAQDILAAGGSPQEQNDVTYLPDGYFRWDLQAADLSVSPEAQGDNPILTERRQVERHRAMFHFEFSGGAFNYELEIEVVNLRKAN